MHVIKCGKFSKSLKLTNEYRLLCDDVIKINEIPVIYAKEKSRQNELLAKVLNALERVVKVVTNILILYVLNVRLFVTTVK